MNDKEFKVNKYILLRLEGKYTVIYVNGKRFNYCKGLFIFIPEKNVEKYDGIRSIDEVSEVYDDYLINNNMYKEENGKFYHSPYSYYIPPETEFWGHCSNLQAWVEHDYDTRLLHSNLAFPLLKALSKAGDPIAEKVFKEEIAKRISSGYCPTIIYLILEGYFFFLTIEEFLCALDNCREKIDYLEYIKLIYEVMMKWDDYVFSSADIKKRIIRREGMIKFFMEQLMDSKMHKCLENYNDGFYDRLNEDLMNIFICYFSACMCLCWEYCEVNIYDKLLQHCKFMLSQDTKTSLIWKYLAIAYRKKNMPINAKVAENIFQIKEKLEQKRMKKKYRKESLRRFFWRFSFRNFKRRYWRFRRHYRGSVRDGQW